MESEPFYKFTLLRHAESEGNAGNLWQGQEDYPLTVRGKSQAAALANRWLAEGVSFDLAITSPLSRALDTAKIITLPIGVNLEILPEWMERNNGNLAGTHPDERAVMPDFLYPYLPIGESGESTLELFLRAGRALQSLFKRPPGHYLVVSHGGILNMILFQAFGITPLAQFRGPRFAFGNTGFSTLKYFPTRGQWQVLGINDTRHLSALGKPLLWQR